jgi:uncharacterized protein YdhG (YjbR/CyaY superfamily)
MPRGTAGDDVSAYLAAVPARRREGLARIRALCREHLPGFDEVIAYGMPAYLRDGTTEIAFASQKQYISFYLMRSDVRDAFAARLRPGHG